MEKWQFEDDWYIGGDDLVTISMNSEVAADMLMEFLDPCVRVKDQFTVAMKKAIELLEHELSYAKANRDECDKNDDFYEGWIECLKYFIGVLQSNISKG